MPLLDYITAGESHGPAVVTIVSGLPAGLELDVAFIDSELRRRQGGYGRGARQRIEADSVEILSGVRQGKTIGSPLTLLIRNKDARLDDPQRTPPVMRPRPGHADLAGALKYLSPDARNILERASARETAARTAAGALARCLLRQLGIEVFGFVRSIGTALTDVMVTAETWQTLRSARDSSETYCPDASASVAQISAIHQAKTARDTVGGLIEAHVFGVPPGLGSCMDWRDRLDARLAAAAMSIQAIKAVEIGLGKEVAARPGSEAHDPIGFDRGAVGSSTLGFTRPTNNAGGIEGGMSNGQPIVIRAAMKPISTLLRGMPSVDLVTRQPQHSDYERSDVCAVPAASVVLENVAAFEIARAAREKFGGDTLTEFKCNYEHFLRCARELGNDARS